MCRCSFCFKFDFYFIRYKVTLHANSKIFIDATRNPYSDDLSNSTLGEDLPAGHHKTLLTAVLTTVVKTNCLKANSTAKVSNCNST